MATQFGWFHSLESEGLAVNQKLKMLQDGVLKSTLWTLAGRYQEVADFTEWDDEQIEFVELFESLDSSFF